MLILQILYKPQKYNKKYIIKPIVGGFGKDIKDFTTNTILDDNEYIIQEKIIQKKIRGHFRIITLYNKVTNSYDLGYIYLCFNAKNKIASNNHNGGVCHEVHIKENTIRYIENDDIHELYKYYSSDIINNITSDCIVLHKKLPKYIITVGWDIMIENNKFYFLEGNVPHSTVFKNDKYFYQKSIYINKLIYDSIF